jgi:hypothetical protein
MREIRKLIEMQITQDSVALWGKVLNFQLYLE